MRDGVMVLDHSNKIIYANQSLAEIFAAPLSEIIDKRLLEVTRLVELANLINEVRAAAELKEKEIRLFFPSEKVFSCSANTIKSEAEEALVVLVMHDISEIRKLENLRREFVANVSHELKTPLTAIRNYAETLLSGAIEDKEHNRGFLQKIEKHTDNLSALIDDLLEISRLESKRELGAFGQTDAEKIVRRAMETVSGKADRKKVEVKMECKGSRFFVYGVEDHLYRAVLNLLDNAVNYTNEGGEVSIALGRLADRVEVSVSDTGIGISAEHLSRIFERFYRVDKARSRELGGTGLGLAIVKHVMNIHNGSVSVESEEGKGSRFTLAFPSPES